MLMKQCILLAAGLYLTSAFDDLSFKAVASQSPEISDPNNQYMASKALDRITTTCMRTDVIGPNAPHKRIWWKVDLGGVYNIYSINILFKDYDGFEYRQRGRLAGFSLYVSNTGDIEGSTLCYNDGPQLPPLNFTTTCTEYGRYVIFYNERLDSVNYPEGYELINMYTELCEVIVKGCKQHGVYGTGCVTPCPDSCDDNMCHIQSGNCFDCKHGKYGSYCNMPCPVNCKENKCRMQNGSCLECTPGLYSGYCNQSCPTNCKDKICNMYNGSCITCKPGWTERYCEKKCEIGWHGINCSQRCSGHCRNSATCNHVTGHCDTGCNDGWTGYMCEKECSDGTYGYNCKNNCSGHCMNNTLCNKQTGHCDGGCNPGYTNAACSKKCNPGNFGLNCSEHCSGHCENHEPCNHVSGMCLNNCQDGYSGEYCNSSCQAGTYGKDCTLNCSSNCTAACQHTERPCIECWNRFCFKVNDETDNGLLSTQTNNIHIIVGAIVCTCIVLTIGVVIFIYILRLKRRATMFNKRESIILEAKPQIKIRQQIDNNLHDYKENDLAYSTYAVPEKIKRGPPINKNISVRNIMAQISNMSANENAGFKSEYHDIPRGELHPCIEAKKPENKVKNRYTTIFPYDHSRIIIKPLPADGSGYINASYIEDTRGKRLYIATQGRRSTILVDSIFTLKKITKVFNVFVLFKDFICHFFFFIKKNILRPKAKNNNRLLDYGLARRSV